MRKNRNKSEMKINYKNILKIVIPILIIIIFLLIINYVRKDKNNDKIGKVYIYLNDDIIYSNDIYIEKENKSIFTKIKNIFTTIVDKIF